MTPRQSLGAQRRPWEWKQRLRPQAGPRRTVVPPSVGSRGRGCHGRTRSRQPRLQLCCLGPLGARVSQERKSPFASPPHLTGQSAGAGTSPVARSSSLKHGLQHTRRTRHSKRREDMKDDGGGPAVMDVAGNRVPGASLLPHGSPPGQSALGHGQEQTLKGDNRAWQCRPLDPCVQMQR